MIVSKPTNIITQESPCKGTFVESYLQDAPVTGGGMMAIHRDRSVADLKGRRAYFNHCFTASSSPPSRLSYPLLSLYYPSTYVFAYPPSILFLLLLYCAGAYFQLDYADSRGYIHPKFAPICLHFRPCLTLICMLYACYSGFRALYSG